MKKYYYTYFTDEETEAQWVLMPEMYAVSYIVLFPSQVNHAVWVALKLAEYGMVLQLLLKECTVLHSLREIKTPWCFWTIYPHWNYSFSRSQVIPLLLNSMTTFIFLTPKSWLSLHSGNKFLFWLLGQTILSVFFLPHWALCLNFLFWLFLLLPTSKD